MIPITILIPWQGDAHRFEATLASILRHRSDGCQVVVAHDGSWNDPYHLGAEIDWVVGVDCTWTGLIASAASRIQGEVLVLVHEGVELGEGWETPVLESFQDDRVGCVTPILAEPHKPNRLITAGFRLDRSGTRQMVGRGRRLERFRLNGQTVIGPTRYLAAYRASLLHRLDWSTASLPDAYADVELALAVRESGFDNRVRGDWIGWIDDREWVETKMLAPHGCAAERVVRRHGERETVAGMLGRIAWDLAVSPFQLWRALHAVQRLAAYRYARSDRQFRGWMEEQRHHDSAWSQRPGSAPEPDVSRVDARDRRHAA